MHWKTPKVSSHQLCKGQFCDHLGGASMRGKAATTSGVVMVTLDEGILPVLNFQTSPLKIKTSN